MFFRHIVFVPHIFIFHYLPSHFSSFPLKTVFTFTLKSAIIFKAFCHLHLINSELLNNIMKHSRTTYIKNILFPCFVFSLITGAGTGCIIFLFKVASSYALNTSAEIYSFVRANPIWLPCLIAGVTLIGLISALILKNEHNCRGGGIPTSVAILRGLIDFRWLKSIFFLFASALLTFFGGVPLGNEGPSVQMGTAVGRGTVRLFAKKHAAWDRYIMTGGACGGFAVATGAPLTGILFAFEEAHRRFSPMLFMTAAMTVTSATTVMQLLCKISGVSADMFDFNIDIALPMRYLWLAIFVGVICGLLAIVFTKLYTTIGEFLSNKLNKMPFAVKSVLIFALVSIAGFCADGLIGSGHGIIDELIHGNGVWYMMLIYLCLRALFLIIANRAGISGGIFVPTLAFGALIGAMCSKAAIMLGILPEEYYAIPIIIGMASFLAASSRTPLTAITFALEALSGIANILPITIGVTLAYLIIETWGVTSLHDVVINQKVTDFNKGKKSTIVDTFVTVMPDSFSVGKEIRDILWPPTCIVLSIKKADRPHHSGEIEVGDTLHVHYQTFDRESTFQSIEAIVGEQINIQREATHTVDPEKHMVPEL